MLTPSPTFIPRSWKAAAVAREREKERQPWKEISLIEPPWNAGLLRRRNYFLRDFNPGFRLLDATSLHASRSSQSGDDKNFSLLFARLFSFYFSVLRDTFDVVPFNPTREKRRESKHPYIYISIHLTAVDIASRARSLFHNRVSHYPLSALRIAFYSRRLGTRADFCINECIKDYRHDTIIALARRLYLYTAFAFARARVRIYFRRFDFLLL